MEKLSFAFTLSEEQKKKKEALVARLMKNDHVLAWLKRNGCDEDFVWKHSGKFADWTAVMDKCEGCHGLDFCRQPEKGTRVDLYLDGMLMNQISHCTYYKEQQKQYAHRCL